jgi:ABC transport system ATP-binding/permease protein
MSVLVTTIDISKIYGTKPLFEAISCTVSKNEKIGIVGPNGAGKSTFAKILAGQEIPDNGSVSLKSGVKCSYVAQHRSFEPGQSIRQVVENSLTKDGRDPLDHIGQVNSLIDEAGFLDDQIEVSELSGGWLKRLAILEQMILQPDLLILDEPTNHLDLEGILWLENKIKRSNHSTVFVSHDRYFLDNVATRMIEINRVYRDNVFDVRGNYAAFLHSKSEYLAAQNKEAHTLANKMRREEEWLRHGPKARTTKSQSRIDDAYALRAQLAETMTRAKSGQKAAIEFNSTDRKTKKLVDLKKLSKNYDENTIISNLDLTIAAKMRLGILGANGSGKSTLLKLICKNIMPTSGTVKHADGLRVVYFDQNREDLDPEARLKDVLAPHSDSVIYDDQNIHVVSWAKRFLFEPTQLEVQVKKLSGGEKARLLIARLMLQPADVLVLDEPTNDLDIPTLEILEQSLLSFPGALILVTHDRYMLDRISTVLLGLTKNDDFGFFADYGQWQNSSLSANPKNQTHPKPQVASKNQAAPSPAKQQTSKKRLTYKEQREWDHMEDHIAAAEQQLAIRQQAANDPSIAANAAKLGDAMLELTKAEQHLDTLYQRWSELESKQT